MSRAIAYLVKVTLKHNEEDVHLYLSKRAAKKKGRPWTLKQRKALRFSSRELLTKALRRLEIPLDVAKAINLRIVPLARRREQSAPPRHLARIQYAA